MVDVFEHLGPMDGVPMTRRSVTKAPVWLDDDGMDAEPNGPLVLPMVGLASATAARDVRPRSNTSCVPPSSSRKAFESDSGFFSGPRSMPSSPLDEEFAVLGMDSAHDGNEEDADKTNDSAFCSMNDQTTAPCSDASTCPRPLVREGAEDLATLVAAADPSIPLASPDTFSIKFERMAVSAPTKGTSLMARLFEQEREVAVLAAERAAARRPLATPSSSLPTRGVAIPVRSTHRYKAFGNTAPSNVMFA